MHLRILTMHAERYPETDHYLFNLPVFRRAGYLDFSTPVTLFVGDNGTGKSTLLESIATKCGIHIWRSGGSRVEFNPHEPELHRYLDVEWLNGPMPGSFFGSDIFCHFAQLLEAWAVDAPSQLEFLALLAETTASRQAQFLIATHSPLLPAYPGAVIYSFDRKNVRQVRYENTAHYRIYEDFLEDRSRYLGGWA